MADKKIYPKGIRTFAPREGAPDFVAGTMIITLNDLFQFAKENPELLSEYEGNKQLKCQMLNGDKGVYLTVDTWKPEKKKASAPEQKEKVGEDELPF
jgi:hypothetical protein|tara:strand:- start:3709 stop:3999 length:291 start_codon:yes stop_codon:yes gene_type:complete